MIKIRYRDPSGFGPGFHADAKQHGGRTIIYLRDGLTADQRRAALRRLRWSAQTGHHPPLPRAQLAVALAADRILCATRQTGMIIRRYPAASAVPVMLTSGGMAVVLALSVSVHVAHTPHLGTPGQPPPIAGPAPAASAVPAAAAPVSPEPGTPPGATRLPLEVTTPDNPDTTVAANAPPAASTTASADPGGGTTLTTVTSPSPVPGTPTASPPPAALPSSATPAPPSPASAARTRVCVRVGVLGGCVTV